MSTSMDDLDLGFVKKNPWIIRDREQRKKTLRKDTGAKNDHNSTIEELEYGPGYVKRMREYYAKLAKTPVEVSSNADSGSKFKKPMANSSDYAYDTKNSAASKPKSNADISDQSVDIHQKSIVDLVLEQVERIGQALSQASLIPRPDEAQNLEDMSTVRSIKHRFETGKISDFDTHEIASELRQKTEIACFSLPFDQCGLNDIDQFTIHESTIRPPPTPFPAHLSQFDFDDPANSLSEIDYNMSTLRSSIQDETPVRPPDFWMLKPRRIPSPRRSAENSADYSALHEMKNMLMKFEQKRADSQQELQGDQQYPAEILPNDPSPSIAPKNESSDDSSHEDFLDASLDRAERLRPIKKRKTKIEIIGGGLVPKKTSLASGPKFSDSKVGFSQYPPKAYAYLEESYANDFEQWLPGQELSLEQYEEIREESKRDRYEQFLSSTPYYDYANSATYNNDPGVTPDHSAYCKDFWWIQNHEIDEFLEDPPMTMDDVYFIKLRSPVIPSVPPRHPPPHFDNTMDLFEIQSPPAYEYLSSSDKRTIELLSWK